MAGRKVFVQMGQSKAAKHKTAHKGAFAGALQGRRPEELISLAVAETRKAAEGGDARSQFLLGMAYAEGSGVRQDSAQAAHWWRLAAAQGEAAALCCYGLVLFRGEGVAQDKAQGFTLLRQAAKLGVPEAAGLLRTQEMIDFAMQC